ncbi:von Willebrand factor type A domain-containing protein [Mycena maculata]|uniref:von Willebrand factor type A domain-containing protein n=1 Tax=Mycena maculata TaxID=230809 RepID=A0AAD7NYA8_9AGAR|nr:von Willebrand factor type A domain-containing protein [Mycena maculata]
MAPHTTPLYGLYYYYQQRVVSLPLLHVRAEASIKELAAQVKLTQTYGNDATVPIEARYSFPIPARAAVCSFVMVKQDGTRVVGAVQEKQEARETYNAAVAQGQQASLMEQQTPDVFQVSVGNIPASEQVQIELVYATELAEDEESDSIRFHLPVHIGARYGAAPQSAPSPSPFTSTAFISAASKTPFLNIALSVEAIAPISKIGCPSHTVSTELGPDPKLPNFKELPFSNYARVSLSSDSALDKDFVMSIKSAGLDAPRCVAELHPTHDTVALGLTLVPRFKLPDLSRQEFVFLVDRSGSMGGKRIDAAKKALVVMLRALPRQDSLFQIASFGNRCSFMWSDGGRAYNQETLDAATRHVDAMHADFGGTEVRGALHHVFAARRRDRPTSVLVLTDGDAWDLDGVLNEVKAAVANAPKNAHLRVSVLGIGNSASTAMCEGIARLGNGTCMMVGEEETNFTGKVARMLKAARTPSISDISVDWGRTVEDPEKVVVPAPEEDEFEMVEDGREKKRKTLNIFDEDVDDPMQIDSTPAPPPPAVVLPPPPAVQQAPFAIQNLFPNIRLNVYAILQGKTIPKTITIRGSTADGTEIAFPVPVTLSHLQNTPDAPPAIHALAARKIIQDLEDGRHGLAAMLVNPDDTDLLARTVKASVVRLGKTYSISSTHTSFVAVDGAMPPPLAPARPGGGILLAISAPPPPPPPPPPSFSFGIASPTQILPGTPMSTIQSAAASAPPPPPPMAGFFSAAAAPAPQQHGHFLHKVHAGRPESQDRDRDCERPSHASAWGGAMKKKSSAVAFGAAPTAQPAPTLDLFGYIAPESMSSTSTSTDPLEALARLQSFDGCFSLDVLVVVKLTTDIQTVRGAFPAGATDGLVASVLAMAFLATKLGASVDRDSWEGIYEKAQQYVEAALRDMGATETAVDVLETKVAGMLA